MTVGYGFGQALAYIVFYQVTIKFLDTFTRTTSAPPFAIGTADTGTDWHWTDWDTRWTEATTPINVDGSSLVLPIPSGQTFDSLYNTGATMEDGEFFLDFWVPAAGDSGAETYWYDRNWYINFRINFGDTTVLLRGWDSSGTVTISTRSAWYRLHVLVSSTDSAHVKARFWKVGDTEPSTWVTVQTSWPVNRLGGSYFPGLLDIWETPISEPAKYDNIQLISSVPIYINAGYANAQTLITRKEGYAQAQAKLNAFNINNPAQAQAFIRKSAGYGQAQVRILISPSDLYAYVVSQDGAASYFPMDTFDVPDVIDGQVLTVNGSVFGVAGINPPLRTAQQLSFSSYYLFSSGASLLRLQGSQWTIEGWAKFTNTVARTPVFGLVTSGSQYLSVGRGGATAGSAGSFISVYHFYDSLTHVFSTNTNLPVNGWSHIVVSNDNGTFTFYVDGTQIAQWSATTSNVITFYVQYDPFYGGPTSSTVINVDGIALYDTVLTAAQVQNHFIAGKLQGYGQAQAFISRTIFWGQAAAAIDSPHKQGYGQATFDMVRRGGRGQARALIQPYNGLVAGIWTGAAFTETNVGLWYSETGPNQPNYNAGGLTPPGYPGNDNWGMMWAGTFIADVTGAWTFASSTDDGSQVRIEGGSIPGSAVTGQFSISGKVATMNNNYFGGQGETYRSGTVNLIAGKLYTIQAKVGQGGGPWAFRFYYRRPTDVADNFLTDNNPPWIQTPVLASRVAQAQVYVSPAFNQNVYGQALALIGHNQWGQAQTRIMYSGLVGVGQALAQIGSRKFGSAITQIGFPNGYRKSVLSDSPIMYFPLDETSYGSGVIASIVGRQNLTWDSSGETFGVTGNVLNSGGTAIDFNNHIASNNPVLSESVTVALVTPGPLSDNGANQLSPLFWGYAGDVVTVVITQALSGGNVDIGIQGTGDSAGENLYASDFGAFTTGSVSPGTYSFTLTNTGLHYAYSWSNGFQAGLTGAGTLTYLAVAKDSGRIPVAAGSVVTVEGWIKWDGSVDAMLFGFYRYDIIVGSGGFIGFNRGDGDRWGVTSATIAAGNWTHIAAVMHTAQLSSTANKIYINGVLQTLTSSGTTGNNSYITSDFALGGWTLQNSNRWQSELDEIAIFDYELSAAQVLKHYNSRLNTYGQGQAQALINEIFLGSGQAQAKLNSFNFPRFGQANADIKAFNLNQYAQANAVIKAQDGIVKIHLNGSGVNDGTYSDQRGPQQPNYADTNNTGTINNEGYAFTAAFNADATGTWSFRVSVDDSADFWIGNTRIIDAGFLTRFAGEAVFDGTIALTSGQTYTFLVRFYQGGGPWAFRAYYKRPSDSVWYFLTDNNPPWIQINANAGFGQVNAQIVAPIRVSGQANADILATNNKFGQANSDIKATSRGYGQAQAFILGITVYGQAQVDVKARYTGSGQALTYVGHFKAGQAQVRVSPGYGAGIGQVNADIVHTNRVFGLALAAIDHGGHGQANADIKKTIRPTANVLAFILPPTFYGQAQAKIIAFGVNRFAQANADIHAITRVSANAQAFIHKGTGFGLALSIIKTSRGRGLGQAKAYIGHFKPGLAQAFISKSAGRGQSQASIRRTFQAYAQAQVQIYHKRGYAQANADIILTIFQSAQALAFIGAIWISQAQADIQQTYFQAGQAKARIKTTYRGSGQAQAWIRENHSRSGQARAYVIDKLSRSAQAQVYINHFKFGQAQARMIGFNVPRIGQAQAYLVANPNVTPPGPTSDAATYLVSYNNQRLPGYAQSESYDSVMKINTTLSPYVYKTSTDILGLSNKEIDITMRVWENDYPSCKAQVQKAATLLRSVKNSYAKLYLQHYDKYYLARTTDIKIEQNAKTSNHILDYNVQFAVKPWLVNNSITTISGTGTISTDQVSRTISDGGWTPTIIRVTGTNITVSGYTATAFTGYVSVSGAVTDLIIDTENFTAYEGTTNRNDIISPLDRAIYVGPGKTTYVISGAISCTIEWQNRWYL